MQNKDIEIKALNKALKEFKVFSENYTTHFIDIGNKHIQQAFNGSNKLDNEYYLPYNKQLNFD